MPQDPKRQPGGSLLTDPDYPHVFGGACRLVRVMGLVSGFVRAGILWPRIMGFVRTGRGGYPPAPWPCGTNHGPQSRWNRRRQELRSRAPKTRFYFGHVVRMPSDKGEYEGAGESAVHGKILEICDEGEGRPCASRAPCRARFDLRER